MTIVITDMFQWGVYFCRRRSRKRTTTTTTTRSPEATTLGERGTSRDAQVQVPKWRPLTTSYPKVAGDPFASSSKSHRTAILFVALIPNGKWERERWVRVLFLEPDDSKSVPETSKVWNRKKDNYLKIVSTTLSHFKTTSYMEITVPPQHIINFVEIYI